MLTKDQLVDIKLLSPVEGLTRIASFFPEGIVFSSSLGQEDQVLTDMIGRNNIPINIFTIDTGRLFNETLELLDRTIARYKIPIRVYYPDATNVETFVNSKGINSFYESVENRKSCCYIRKVEPLNRALAGAKVWVTGLRADQSDNRKKMEVIEWDEERQLYKYNPLLHWNMETMLAYIEEFNVPYNRLHDNGFISIGCAPCTRAIESGEQARAGRWWWEQSQKECGLHQTVIK
jgi:phosphoadenosine phosphosulfate reductase